MCTRKLRKSAITLRDDGLDQIEVLEPLLLVGPDLVGVATLITSE